jgi:hypothetical protein
MMPKSTPRSSVTKTILWRVHWKEAFISPVRPDEFRRVLDEVNDCNCFWSRHQHGNLKVRDYSTLKMK